MLNINDSFKISKQNFSNGFKGDALLINIKEIKMQYNYIGLWYARDSNEKNALTTEIYYSNDEISVKPDKYNIELKENHFRNINKYIIDLNYKWVWIATRIDNNIYCNLKTDSLKNGQIYINYKVIHNKAFGFDIVNQGVFKGSNAEFFALYSENNNNEKRSKEAIMFVTFIKDYPPPDWNINHKYINIDNLPILANVFKFTDDKKYSDWLGQNPVT